MLTFQSSKESLFLQCLQETVTLSQNMGYSDPQLIMLVRDYVSTSGFALLDSSLFLKGKIIYIEYMAVPVWLGWLFNEVLNVTIENV